MVRRVLKRLCVCLGVDVAGFFPFALLMPVPALCLVVEDEGDLVHVAESLLLRGLKGSLYTRAGEAGALSALLLSLDSGDDGGM